VNILRELVFWTVTTESDRTTRNWQTHSLVWEDAAWRQKP